MTILFILITILLFGALIAIHEFGHFIAAKTLGVRVEEFAIGMGPKLLSRTRGETTYSLRALPIGGFCSMEGEEEASDDPRSFSGKPAWKKFIILVAGAFLNFVTGLVILLVLFSVAGSPSAPVVSGYLPGAEDIRETGLLPGDEFYRIDGHRIYFQSDAILFLGRAGEDVAVEVLRDGRRLDLGTLHLPYRTLTDESGQQSLKRGVMVGELREAGPLGTLRNAWYQSIDYVRTVWLSLGDLIRGAVSLNDMAGPIGIFAMAGEVGHMSIVYHGEPCPCGRRGCWERYASASALKRLTARAMEEHPGSILCRVVAENNGKVSGQSAFIAAREGDPVGQSVCDEYIGYLAAGVTNVVNIFQPDTLAIGGGVSNESDEQLLLPLRRLVEQESIPCNRDKRTRIVKAQLGNNAGIIGAALLGKRKLRK